MIKTIFLAVSFLLCIFINGQSVDKGRLQLKLGSSVYFGKTLASNNFSNGSSFNGGDLNFTSIQFPFSIHYNTHRNFALGFFVQSANGNKDSTSFNTGSLGFIAEYYLLNKPKFNLFLDVSVGGMNYEGRFESDIIDATLNYSFSGKGSVNSIGIGVNKYFGNIFGLTFRTGYMRNAIRTTNLSINQEVKEYVDANQVKDLKMLFNGAYLNLGIVIKLLNKSPKSE